MKRPALDAGRWACCVSLRAWRGGWGAKVCLWRICVYIYVSDRQSAARASADAEHRGEAPLAPGPWLRCAAAALCCLLLLLHSCRRLLGGPRLGPHARLPGRGGTRRARARRAGSEQLVSSCRISAMMLCVICYMLYRVPPLYHTSPYHMLVDVIVIVTSPSHHITPTTRQHATARTRHNIMCTT
jgi:hypothetical protein